MKNNTLAEAETLADGFDQIIKTAQEAARRFRTSLEKGTTDEDECMAVARSASTLSIDMGYFAESAARFSTDLRNTKQLAQGHMHENQREPDWLYGSNGLA